MLLFQQMLVLFIIMIIGYVCYKKNIIDQNASRAFTFLVVNIANPALILSGSINKESEIDGSILGTTIILAIVLYIVLILLAILMTFILNVPKQNAGVYKVMTIFSNIGFMGFPVIQALYGTEALLYASIFLFPYNILIYTYGIREMKKDKTQKTSIQWSNIFNIGVISCIISILIFFTDIQMPAFVKTTVTNLSNLTAPLSMIVIGVSLAQIDLKSLFMDVRLILFSILKLLVIPIITMFVLSKFIDNEILLGVCMIMIATPVGSMTAMLAQQYDGDVELASRGVALTTILSVMTIPIVSNVLLYLISS